MKDKETKLKNKNFIVYRKNDLQALKGHCRSLRDFYKLFSVA